MKDFQQGDKISYIHYPEKLTIENIDERWHTLHCINAYGDPMVVPIDQTCGPNHNVFYGHNVTIEVHGEELPERLQTEGIDIMGDFVVSMDLLHNHCRIIMPSHIASQYREWLEKEGQ